MGFEEILKELENQVNSTIETNNDVSNEQQEEQRVNQSPVNEKLVDKVIESINTTKKHVKPFFELKFFKQEELDEVTDLDSFLPIEYEESDSNLIAKDKENDKTFRLSKRYIPSPTMIKEFLSKLSSYKLYGKVFNGYRYVLLIVTENHKIQIVDQLTGAGKLQVFIDSLDNVYRFTHTKGGQQKFNEMMQSIVSA